MATGPTTVDVAAPTPAAAGVRADDAFEVTPAALRGAAGTFDGQGEALAAAARRLRSHLEALGPCWGEDEVGTRFGAAYLPAARQTLTNLAALAVGLDRIGAALTATADSFEALEVGPGTRGLAGARPGAVSGP